MRAYTLIGICALLAACHASTPFTNPLIDANHPDPGVLALEDGSGFVLVSTSNYVSSNEGPAFPILFSQDLASWTQMGHVFPQNQWPSWAHTDFWAPEIRRVNDNYHVYFSARQTSNGQLCIGVARSVNPLSPFGPYEDLGRPLLEGGETGDVIDVHWFKDPKTSLNYLLWVGWDIYMRQIQEDGVTFVEDYPARIVMENDRPEDAGISEGPTIIYIEPYYYLIFSGNVFTSPYYHVTAARSTEVDAGYVRYEGEQFLHVDADRFDAGQNCTFVGPGHGTPVYVAAEDEWWYVYHTWRYDMIDQYPPGRVLNADKMRWTEDAWPIVGKPSDYPVAIGQGPTYTNPVVDSNHPDPGALALEDGSGFVLVSTSNYASDNSGPAFPILFSSDLVTWTEMGHVFPQGAWPSWARTDMWAPEIQRVDDNYHVYFSARNAGTNQLAIGVARSQDPSSPYGPYEDLGQPLLEDPLGVIDIHWFRDPRTTIPYLVYKTDDNALGLPSSIYVRRVAEDGVTFDEAFPARTVITAEGPEDNNVVEGPSIIYREPFYYMIFSANGYVSPNYHVSVARSTEVDGDYVRYGGEQFLHTDFDKFDAGQNCTFVGAGHGTPLYLAAADEWWYVYHTWRYDQVGDNPPGRVLNLDPIRWTSDDWPIIGVPSYYPVEIPSI